MMTSSVTTYSIPNLKQIAFDYAFEYCEKIAEAKFHAPSEFIKVVEMFYESLIEDTLDESE